MEASARGSLFHPTRDRLVLLSWVVAPCFLWYNAYAFGVRGWMVDAHTYWAVWDQTPMYGSIPLGQEGAFLYSPAFAQVIWPLTLLPWWAFSVAWLLMSASAYLWMVRPLRWMWSVPLLSLALEDVVLGNSTWLVALACVFGLRWSVVWIAPLLTKITPGIGMVWFAGRRNGTALAWSAGLTLISVAVSFAISPQLWIDWLSMLSANRSPWVTLRVLLGALIVLMAARAECEWWVPVAIVLATPVLEPYALAALCALPRLLSREMLGRARAPYGGVVTTVRRALDLRPGAAGT